jgi:hypothetical protein
VEEVPVEPDAPQPVTDAAVTPTGGR